MDGEALALADALAMVLERAIKRQAQAGFVRSAVGRRDGVAVGMDEAVLDRQPGDRPFDRAVLALFFHLAGENLVGDQLKPVDVGGEIFLQAAREAEGRLGRHFAVRGQQRGRAPPANFDAAEQVGLGARHPEHAGRVEAHGLAENLLVGMKAHLGAALIGDFAEGLEFRDGDAALEGLAISHLAAPDLDLKPVGQRVDDGDADAVEAAGRLIGAAVEFAAGVQLGHDDFERGLPGEFRVRVDRHAAAVVGDGQPIALFEADLDRVGVARRPPRPSRCR